MAITRLNCFMMSPAKSDDELYRSGLKSYDVATIKSMLSRKILIYAATSIALVLFASAAKGEIFLFAVMLWKNWNRLRFLPKPSSFSTFEPMEGGKIFSNTLDVTPSDEELSSLLNNTNASINVLDEFLKQYHLQHCYIHVLGSLASSFFLFFLVGGFFQWKYYIKQRHRPEDWKCQPKKFLTAENERHEILLGSGCLLVNGTISGLVATYIVNGGNLSVVYFDINQYGWPYFIFSTILVFMMQNAGLYYYHRLLHLPFLYRNFHKWHHRYHSPTAFSAVAIHPIESIVFEMVILAPVFIVPCHFVGMVACLSYLFYFGMVDHSGIDLHSILPWQAPARFHDDHHKYFHCNFGHNVMIFDRFHGTMRRKDRRYGEDVFYGKGAPMKGKKE